MHLSAPLLSPFHFYPTYWPHASFLHWKQKLSLPFKVEGRVALFQVGLDLQPLTEHQAYAHLSKNDSRLPFGFKLQFSELTNANESIQAQCR
jgi:hypothetical protein